MRKLSSRGSPKRPFEEFPGFLLETPVDSHTALMAPKAYVSASPDNETSDWEMCAWGGG